ncbi:hypothetical protein FACS189425_04730 [Clostridia bacterium]|nr:hypothetical protein FACS189425_04730 [Clostridia bacterium]
MFGNELRGIRKQAEMTQADFAQVIGVSQQTIARWEAGKIIPDLAAIEKIALCFNADFNRLVLSATNDSSEKTSAEEILRRYEPQTDEERKQKLICDYIRISCGGKEFDDANSERICALLEKDSRVSGYVQNCFDLISVSLSIIYSDAILNKFNRAFSLLEIIKGTSETKQPYDSDRGQEWIERASTAIKQKMQSVADVLTETDTSPADG